MTTPIPESNAFTPPPSVRIQPWSEFPKQSYSIHTDEFCHEKPLVLKFQTKSTKSILNIKETLTQKEGKWNIDDDVKLWFTLGNSHSLYTRIKSTNYLKLHLDHGLYDWKNQQWNIYSTFWTDRSILKSSFRIGVASIHPRCVSDSRLRVNMAKQSHGFHFYNRTSAYWKQSKFGLVAVYDLTNKILQKNNILLGHVFNDRHETFLRLENNGFRMSNPDFNDFKSIWDVFTANYVGRLDQTTKVGLQVRFNLRDNTLRRIEGVIEKILPEQGIVIKAKLNNHQDIAFLFKRAMWGYENLLTVSTGFGINKATTDKQSIHYGVQLDFNI